MTIASSEPILAAPSDQWRSLQRANLAFLVLAGPLVLLLADTVVALARGWHFDTRLDRVGAGLFLIALLLAVVIRLWPAGRTFLARYAPQLCLASVSMICSLLVAEIASGLLLPLTEPPIHLRKPHQQTVYRPIPDVMRGVQGESRTVINSAGVRGSEMPTDASTYSILCLGGSSTNCTYLDQSETWPARLEQNLKTADSSKQYWVGNIGVPSLTTHEHLRFLGESTLPQQVNCIVLQAGINDFMQAIVSKKSPPPPLWIRSSLWRLATNVARRYLNSPDVVVEDAAGTSYVRRREQRIDAEKIDKLPELEKPLAEYADRLRAMIARCRELGVRIVVTSQPVLWSHDVVPENEKLYWFGRIEADRFLATPELRKGIDRYNEVTRQVCDELDVEWIDLSELNGHDEVFYDDCHFTEEGARQVARRITDYLLAHPPLVPPSLPPTAVE